MTPKDGNDSKPNGKQKKKMMKQKSILKVESFKVDQTKTTKEAKRKRAIKTNVTLSSIWSLCPSSTCPQLWFHSWPYLISMGSCSQCDASDASPMLLQSPYSDVIPQPLFDSDPPSRYSPFTWNEWKILYWERSPSRNWCHVQEKSL